MSGGAYDYSYLRLDDMIEQLSRSSSPPLRRAFAAHLARVRTAMRAVEWVDSFDSAQGSENEAIVAVLGGADTAKRAELEQLIADAERSRSALDAALERARKA